MNIPEPLKTQLRPFVPLMASSLLNSTYSYLLWSKPLETDKKTFEDAYVTVVKQWEAIMNELYEKLK